MHDTTSDMTVDDAGTVLWPLIRRQAGLSIAEQPSVAWRAALDNSFMAPIGMDAHYAAVSEALGKVSASASATEISPSGASGTSFASQCGLYNAGSRAHHRPPRMACHMWRLTFGGMSAGMRHRLDDPAGGFTYRGRRMESAVAEAIRECLPPGVVSVTPQPAPERIPRRPCGALPPRRHLARPVETRRSRARRHHRHNHHAGRPHDQHTVRVGRKLGGRTPA